MEENVPYQVDQMSRANKIIKSLKWKVYLDYKGRRENKKLMMMMMWRSKKQGKVNACGY